MKRQEREAKLFADLGAQGVPTFGLEVFIHNRRAKLIKLCHLIIDCNYRRVMSLERASSNERMSWMRVGEKQLQGHGRTTIQCSLDHCSTSTRIRETSNRYTILLQYCNDEMP